MTRTGGITARGKSFMMRVRIGNGNRLTVTLHGCKTAEAAAARKIVITEVAQELVDAGLAWMVKDAAEELAIASNNRVVVALRKATSVIVASADRQMPTGITLQQLCDRWVSGTLARDYPDHVRAKRSAAKDAGLFRKHIGPIVGSIPVASFRMQHAKAIMAAIPPERSPVTRRHVAQVLSRLFNMAVMPLEIIPVSPLPRGFLPRLKDQKAKPYLFPKEEALLLACTDIPLRMRVLYGFLAREGPRSSEALLLDWDDIDATVGVLNLEKNKTDDPRAWALGASTKEALKRWQKLSPDAPFPLDVADRRHMAETFRQHLKRAGVDRKQLFDKSESRMHVQLHDLRATFVTLSLANGATDSWVRDRTGHRTTSQLDRYRRAARTAQELRLGPLGPMHKLIPELARVGSGVGSGTRRGDRR